jgi:TetR/AcrR family fatty acid metabolism transcriptional regulator
VAVIAEQCEMLLNNESEFFFCRRFAKQAGVADGTIYLYFKNKEDILISLFKEKMGQFIERPQRRPAWRFWTPVIGDSRFPL